LIRRVNEGEDEGDQFRARINSNSMDDAIIRGIIDRHDGKSIGSISTLRKKLIAWSELPSSLYRTYFFYAVPQLKDDQILELNGQANLKENKDALFDLVVNCERNIIRRKILLKNNEDVR
jgi:hypothetical protein